MSAIKQHSEDFEKWVVIQDLSDDMKKRYIRKIKTAANGNLGALQQMLAGSKTDRLALRNFINFLYEINEISLEERERFREIIKLKNSTIEDIDGYDDNEIIEILKRFKSQKSTKYYLLLRLAIESGLRRKHCIITFNKIVLGNAKITSIGSGAVRITLFEKQNEKKAFYCYCSQQTIQEIQALKETINYKTIHNKTKGVEFNKIRKWWTNTALDVMNESIIDFVQGRAPDSIRAKHYIQKRKKADEQYPRVLELIEKHIYSKVGGDANE